MCIWSLAGKAAAAAAVSFQPMQLHVYLVGWLAGWLAVIASAASILAKNYFSRSRRRISLISLYFHPIFPFLRSGIRTGRYGETVTVTVFNFKPSTLAGY